jgi:hypothetical protein
MQLAMADVASLDGATVQAYILDGERTVSNDGDGVRRVVTTTRKARLTIGGEEIDVWVPFDTSVPEGSLVEVRVGEYGYYFEALIDD